MPKDEEIYFDFQELRGKIKSKYPRQEDFAKALGISESTLSKKLNNKKEFTIKEIFKSCKLLEIEISDEYFFKQKVQETEHKNCGLTQI